VVHRDLKPANVLVGADGHVRLLDFGIARLLDDDADDNERPTRPGQLVLTPEYAAPEQTRGEPASVAMDVYAMGVMLHELLTGARPAWQRLVMTRAPADAIQRAMVPPSRSAPDETRARALRGDLDLVILKALAPEPTERYATVEELRADLRRILDGYPVVARRATHTERAIRLVRRNPVLATAWGIAATLAIAFVASTIVQGRRVASERDRTAVERDRANAQRDRAQTTSRLLATMFDRADPFAPGRGDTLRVTQILAEGIERVNRELIDQPAARAGLLSAIGRAYLGLGRYDDAQVLLDTARTLQERDPTVTADERAATLTALGNLARVRGRATVADSMHGQALALRTTSTDVPSSSTPTPAGRAGFDAGALAIALTNVGASHMERNRFDSARVYMDSALAVVRAITPPDSARLAEILNNRATLAMRMNDFPTAARLAGDALDINRVRLGPDHPRVAGELANLGFLLDRTGRSADAEPMLRESLRLLSERMPPEHRTVRSARLTLGGILSRTGRLEEAERMIGEVVTVERAIGADARVPLTVTLDNYAGVLEKLGREREAQAAWREAHSLRRSVTSDADPGAAILLSKLAGISCRLDEANDAVLDEFTQSLGVLDRAFPAGHPFRLGARGQYGACLVRAGQRAAGERELLEVFDAARRGPPQVHAIARQFGRELLGVNAAPADSAARALIQARLDSLTGPPRPEDQVRPHLPS
jgi:serine/threonine-protein kinase